MKKYLKTLIKNLFNWIFKEELSQLKIQSDKLKDYTLNYETQEKRIKNLLGNIDVSVDYHKYSRSWAVVSIQGQKSDFIKFVDLGESDIREIQKFLYSFDREKRVKVDALPPEIQLMKFNRF